jgi:hypothetical protein
MYIIFKFILKSKSEIQEAHFFPQLFMYIFLYFIFILSPKIVEIYSNAISHYNEGKKCHCEIP